MSRKFYADHEEVFDYTTAAGLRGIVRSKSLWASHTHFLNDTEEGVSFSKRILPMILKPEFQRYVAESEELSARVQATDHLGVNLFDHWLGLGGILARIKGASSACHYYRVATS
jgi:hypothetical protein